MKTTTLLKGLAFSLLASSFATPLFAAVNGATVTSDGIVYVVKDGKGAIGLNPGMTGDIIIPEEVTFDGDTTPTEISAIIWGAFQKCPEMTSITFPETMTKIETYAFDNCDGLTEVEIPSNVNMLGSTAFINCDNLKKVTFKATGAPYMWGGDNLVVPADCDIYIEKGAYETVVVGDNSSKLAKPFSEWDETTYQDMYEDGVKIGETTVDPDTDVDPDLPAALAVGDSFIAGSGNYTLLDENNNVSWKINTTAPLDTTYVVIPATVDYTYADADGVEQTATYNVTKVIDLRSTADAHKAATGVNVSNTHHQNITRIDFPGTVTLSENVFKEVYALTSMNTDEEGVMIIPEGIEVLPVTSFLSSTVNIKRIELPTTLTKVGNNCFGGGCWDGVDSKVEEIIFKSTAPVELAATKSIFDFQPMLKKITFLSEEAPIVNDFSFAAPNTNWQGNAQDSKYQTKDVIVYAPSADAVEAYKTAFAGKEGCVTDVQTDVVTGVATDAIATAQVAAMGDAIVVAGAEVGTAVQVYSITGATVATATAQGDDLQFTLPAGVYIVTIDGAAYKVVL